MFFNTNSFVISNFIITLPTLNKKIMEYIVVCTKIYNGTIAVNADSKEEALKKAQDIVCENDENVSWEFGESTADYVEQ